VSMPSSPAPLLSSEEHLELLDCIQKLYRCRSIAAFPEHALAAIAPVVPSTLSAFNEVNLPRNRIVWIVDRPLANEAHIRERWEHHGAEHPLVRYVTATGDGQAIKVSDFLSARSWHEHPIYRAVYCELDAEDQLSLTIRSDAGFIIALAFNRSRRDFTESERMKLNLLRPHLLQAYANVEELAGHIEETDDLRTALRETGHGVIALEPDGQVAHATPGVLDCVARYFPDDASTGVLPGPVLAWLARDGSPTFTTATAAGTLYVRRAQNAERRVLLVSEEIQRPLPNGARLTARETEVLRWLADGKSNAEIAAILGLAVGTVKRHVENVLAKLGAENRTAAAGHVPPTRGV
jgi:DNA-binding CsgD family transcriptional regulator